MFTVRSPNHAPIRAESTQRFLGADTAGLVSVKPMFVTGADIPVGFRPQTTEVTWGPRPDCTTRQRSDQNTGPAHFKHTTTLSLSRYHLLYSVTHCSDMEPYRNTARSISSYIF